MKRSPLISLLCLAIALAVAAGANAQTFVVKSIPDFYQHQKYGPKNNGIEDPSWEKDGGWCLQVSTINQFFYFKKKDQKYKTILPDDVIADPPKWLPASSSAIQKLVVDEADDSALRASCKKNDDPKLDDFLTCVLFARGVGPNLGAKNGLVHVTLQQGIKDTYPDGTYDETAKDDGYVYYEAAGGGVKKFRKDKTNLFTAMQRILLDGGVANLYLGHSQTDKLWWSGDKPYWDPKLMEGGNYHSVTVSIFDSTKGGETLWFADPDSNPDHNYASKVLVPLDGVWLPGNMNRNGGWLTNNGMQECGVDGKKHGDQQCIRLRRFVGNEPVPVPVNNPPDKKDIAQRYFKAALNNDLKTFNITDPGYDRYNGTMIWQLNVITTVQGWARQLKATGPDGYYNIFDVSPANVGSTIDEFWIFPVNEQIVGPLPQPDGWSVQLEDHCDQGPTLQDCWGNERPYPWVHAVALNGGLQDLDSLPVQYQTNTGAVLSAWDFFARDQEDDANLRVQALGANPDLPPNQNPGQ